MLREGEANLSDDLQLAVGDHVDVLGVDLDTGRGGNVLTDAEVAAVESDDVTITRVLTASAPALVALAFTADVWVEGIQPLDTSRRCSAFHATTKVLRARREGCELGAWTPARGAFDSESLSTTGGPTPRRMRAALQTASSRALGRTTSSWTSTRSRSAPTSAMSSTEP